MQVYIHTYTHNRMYVCMNTVHMYDSFKHYWLQNIIHTNMIWVIITKPLLFTQFVSTSQILRQLRQTEEQLTKFWMGKGIVDSLNIWFDVENFMFHCQWIYSVSGRLNIWRGGDTKVCITRLWMSDARNGQDNCKH